MDSVEAALERLCDPCAQVSAHYLICPAGRLWQLVDEAQRAWHAGAGAWQGMQDINSRSIGVELANDGETPFPDPQIRVLERLLAQIMARWQITPADVIGHSDMAPMRKDDPGPRFDWRRLALQGLAVWPEGMGPDLPLTDSLDRIGYPPADADKRLHAFRARFRPWACGAGQAQPREGAQDRRRASAVAAGFDRAREVPSA
ncbi:MAG: N-acetylmuramoyl-L-alanine amidase [Rhodobacteraceae bacterium]|nr:N-acetylmuramoyl-L-alanine amidase [Paracoccaceae bacterium]